MKPDADDSMLYFAYGSNMATSRLRAPDRVPQAEPCGCAILRDFGLRWHKRSKDGSGKCDVVPSLGECVHGVLFRIPPGSWCALDRVEGVGHGYERCVVIVDWQERKETVFTYRATETDPALIPYDCYKAHVLRGAREHVLPEDYVRALESVASMPRPSGHSCDRSGKGCRMSQAARVRGPRHEP